MALLAHQYLNFRAAARSGLHEQAAAESFGALPHADEAEAAPVGDPVGLPTRVESGPVIGYRELQAAAIGQPDPDGLGVAVADGVADRFAYDPQHVRPNLETSVGVFIELKVQSDLGAFGQPTCYKPGQVLARPTASTRARSPPTVRLGFLLRDVGERWLDNHDHHDRQHQHQGRDRPGSDSSNPLLAPLQRSANRQPEPEADHRASRQAGGIVSTINPALGR